MSTQAKTLEQLITELHTTNGELIIANNDLTNTVVNKTGEIDAAVTKAQADVSAAIAAGDSRIQKAINDFAQSHADMRINYYDRKLHSKRTLIEDNGLVADPNDETRSNWIRVPNGGAWTGYNTYPAAKKLTKVHTVSGYSYEPGYYESPEQYTADWSCTFMQFILTNESATSEQINDNIASQGANVDQSKMGGWWNGSLVTGIPCMNIAGLHPYSCLFVRLVNVVANGASDRPGLLPQNVLQFGGNCNFSIDRVVNYPNISE
ncbi:hypothetical protein [Pseudoalteromonas luteoviolacea]|uniref:Uncharacterized protein n=1 Tax=Pseudoalteromonas luteoviolacea H33 TaxID=1365251 RepID=A0A167FWP0_9GAMM|nr:hypothetical protein [Pseudoalteromonas luteoviolacea]KZN53310.1 hypothetical protein N476_08540 [Pseudoalteromonas luteoviolacea H33]KZN76767.1 hypothetical protein N477_15100 [Pseudoalteromonas luteoviolacea H33-S]MBQ4878922.1 hypothetical protein [Pseudoalteromonas luteoviolacea]MBQ4907901.1 hypothetical protein [Pseudoalteromonas luteoviolacea]